MKFTLRHDNGLKRDGFTGYSWTTFFFGPLPAFFRGDWKAALIGLAVICLSFTVLFIPIWPGFVLWGFYYNYYYTTSLYSRGYRPIITDENKAQIDALLACTPSQYAKRVWRTQGLKVLGAFLGILALLAIFFLFMVGTLMLFSYAHN